MAPRRTIKKRESRMDAAIDAMSPIGFPKKLVQTAVNNLLKVYGGPDGWVFIEGDAYKVLIEALLGDQDDLMEDNRGDGHNENEASTSGCSNRTLVPCSNTETAADALPTNQAADTSTASSQTGNQLSIRSVSTSSETSDQLPIKPVDTLAAAVSEPANHLHIVKATDAVVSAENESNCKNAKSPSHIKAPQPVERCKIVNSPPQTMAPRPEKRCKTANSPLQTKASQPEERCKTGNAPPQTKAPQPVEGLGHQRRRPCYGWISSDDEEEVKLIELPPAPLSQGPMTSSRQSGRQGGTEDTEVLETFRDVTRALQAVTERLNHRGEGSGNQTSGATEAEGARFADFKMARPRPFAGSTDPGEANAWIKSLEKIFDMLQCSEEQKAIWAIFMLEGEAHYWWAEARKMVEVEGTPITWTIFKEEFYAKYFPLAEKDAKEAEFLALKQRNMTVPQYTAKFEELLKFHGIYQENPRPCYKCSRYLGGLNPLIREAVEHLGIEDFAELSSTCRIVEGNQKRTVNYRYEVSRHRPVLQGQQQKQQGKKRPYPFGGFGWSQGSRNGVNKGKQDGCPFF